MQEIRKARKRKGITQEQLHVALLTAGLSVSVTTLKAYESGKWSPDFGDLRTIAHVLETTYFEIDDNIRVDFSPNGMLQLEPLPQQLVLNLDPAGRVNIRIQPSNDDAVGKKMSA
jgi:transcriptional regulator with XRE-family HTH domain